MFLKMGSFSDLRHMSGPKSSALDMDYYGKQRGQRLGELDAYTSGGKTDLEVAQMMKGDFGSKPSELAQALDLDSRGKRLSQRRQEQADAGKSTAVTDFEIAKVNKEMTDLIEKEAGRAGKTDFQQKAQELQAQRAADLESAQRIKDGWDEAVDTFEEEMNIITAQAKLNYLVDDFVEVLTGPDVFGTPGRAFKGIDGFSGKHKFDPDMEKTITAAANDLIKNNKYEMEYPEKLAEFQRKTPEQKEASMKQAQAINEYIAANIDDLDITQLARLQKLTDSCASGHFRDMSTRELDINPAVQKKLIFEALKDLENPTFNLKELPQEELSMVVDLLGKDHPNVKNLFRDSRQLDALSFVGMKIEDMKPREWAMKADLDGGSATITASRKVCSDFAVERLNELAKDADFEEIPSDLIGTIRSIDPKILRDFKGRGIEYEALVEIDFKAALKKDGKLQGVKAEFEKIRARHPEGMPIEIQLKYAQYLALKASVLLAEKQLGKTSRWPRSKEWSRKIVTAIVERAGRWIDYLFSKSNRQWAKGKNKSKSEVPIAAGAAVGKKKDGKDIAEPEPPADRPVDLDTVDSKTVMESKMAEDVFKDAAKTSWWDTLKETFLGQEKKPIKKVSESLPGKNDLVSKPSSEDVALAGQPKAVDLEEVDIKAQMLRDASGVPTTRTPGASLEFEDLPFNAEHITVESWDPPRGKKPKKVSIEQAQAEFEMENNLLESGSLDLSRENIEPRKLPTGVYEKARKNAKTKAEKRIVDIVALSFMWNLPPKAVSEIARELEAIDAKRGGTLYDAATVKKSTLEADFFKKYINEPDSMNSTPSQYAEAVRSKIAGSDFEKRKDLSVSAINENIGGGLKLTPVETRKALKQGNINRSKLQMNPLIPESMIKNGERPTVTEWHRQELNEAMDKFQSDVEIDLSELEIPEFTPAEVKSAEGMINKIEKHNAARFRQNSELEDAFNDWKASELPDTLKDQVETMGVARTNEFGGDKSLGESGKMASEVIVEDGMLKTTLRNERLKLEGEIIYQRNGGKEYPSKEGVPPNVMIVFRDAPDGNGNITRIFDKQKYDNLITNPNSKVLQALEKKMQEMGLDSTKLKKWDDVENNENFKEFLNSNGNYFNQEFLDKHKRKIKFAKYTASGVAGVTVLGLVIFFLVDPKVGAIGSRIQKWKEERACKCAQLRLIAGGADGKKDLEEKKKQDPPIQELIAWGDTAWTAQNAGGVDLDKVVRSCENDFCGADWDPSQVTFQQLDASLGGGYVGVVRVNPDDVMRKRTFGDVILEWLTPGNMIILLFVLLFLGFSMRGRIKRGVATVQSGVSRVTKGNL